MNEILITINLQKPVMLDITQTKTNVFATIQKIETLKNISL